MFSLGLQVYKSCLHGGLKSVSNPYFGLFGALEFFCIQSAMCVSGAGFGVDAEASASDR